MNKLRLVVLIFVYFFCGCSFVPFEKPKYCSVEGVNPQRSHCIQADFLNVSSNPPVFTPVSTLSVDEKQLLEYTMTATDSDSTELHYSIRPSSGYPPLPYGINVNLLTGLLTWTPEYDQQGSYDIVFSVSDSMHIIEQTVTITVNDVNATTRVWPRQACCHL